jgi:hypothetical protein
MSKFLNIIGHDLIKPHLQSIIDRSGTFLFYGPPSIGKRTIAFEIAKYNLCDDSKSDGCQCKSCKIFNSGHPDFLSLGSNGKVLVDDIDTLIEFSYRAPLISKTKVIVVDFVENASIEAANRLLKVLEESSFTYFFITSNQSKVLPTISGRCFKIKFDAISSEDVSNILMKKFGYDPPVARTLGWVGASSSIDIFSNAGIILKHRDMAFDFILNIKDLLSSLDFIDKIDQAYLSVFCDMVILIMTDMLLLKNNIDSIVNADKRDVIQKVSKVLSEKSLILSLSFITQVKKNSYLNVNLNTALKSILIKIQPMMVT